MSFRGQFCFNLRVLSKYLNLMMFSTKFSFLLDEVENVLNFECGGSLITNHYVLSGEIFLILFLTYETK